MDSNRDTNRNVNSDTSQLRAEITALEQKLKEAKRQLRAQDGIEDSISDEHVALDSLPALLLLSDSALPLGSFAYSSGLESFLAHQKSSKSNATTDAFPKFLQMSLLSLALTNIPYLLAAYHAPAILKMLDNDIDASTPCTVARRASIAQGRALLNVWERSFQAQYALPIPATRAVRQFSSCLRATTSSTDNSANGHFAPLWGVISSAMGLPAYEAAYVFLTNHAKGVLSAAVRASVIGPYQAQQILASKDLQFLLKQAFRKVRSIKPEDAGQSVPLLDLWIGRHEKLYSRIFNS